MLSAKRRHFLLGFLCATLASSNFLAPSASASPMNLIANGSFELGTNDAPFGGFSMLSAGSTDLTGWEITQNNIDWDNGFWQSADGVHSLDLNGNMGPGGISQVVTTVPGQLYRLTFSLSGNPNMAIEVGQPIPPQSYSLNAIAGGVSHAYVFDIFPSQDVANMGWLEKEFTFVAFAIVTEVSFSSTTLDNCCFGPVLDNVSLTEVPEPSTIALIGMALLSMLGFGLMRRRALVTAMLVAASSMGLASGASASLLTPAFEAQLATWLGQGSSTFTNIYSAGTGDGNFNSFDWHSAVDGKGATFTLMEVPAGTYCYYFCPTIDQSIIGGYNPQSWNGALYNYNYTPADADRTAFIYNLSTNILFRQILSTDPDPAGAGQFQTFNSLFHGPTFGGGNDIYTNSNFLVNYLFSQSYGTSFTSNLLGTGNDPSVAHHLYGFPLVRLETYTFSTTENVPEPSTIALIAMAMLSMFGFGVMRRFWVHKKIQLKPICFIASAVVFLAANSPSSAGLIETQDFSDQAAATAAGWSGYRNTLNGNNYGFGNSNAGGTFVRFGGLSYFGDTTLGGAFTLQDSFSASGELRYSNVQNNDNIVGIGFFDTTPNLNAGNRFGFAGIIVAEYAINKFRFFAEAVMDDGDTLILHPGIVLDANVNYRWTFSYDALTKGLTAQIFDSNLQLLGMQEINLGGLSPYFSLNAFGLTNGQLDGDGRPRADVHIDNLSYSRVESVPEPSTITLIGMALLSMFGFGLMRRRAEA